LHRGDAGEHLTQGRRLDRRVPPAGAGGEAVDIGFRYAVLAEPGIDGANRVVEYRLGGIAGDENACQ